MYIEKTEIIADLRARGLNERADWVDRDLPPLVDTQKHSALLHLLGIDMSTITVVDVAGPD
jgi:hypothetical protein